MADVEALPKKPLFSRLTLSLLVAMVVVVSLAVAFAPRGGIDLTKPVALKVEDVPGLKMYLNPDCNVITPTVLHIGVWEPNETRFFTQVTKPGDTVIDIGANAGYYTIIASKLVGPKGRVFAFEPDPVSFELLKKNVALNNCTNVIIEQKALSDKKGKLTLFVAEKNKGDHRVYQPAGESRSAIDVEAVALDEYLKDHPGQVNVIKMDVQGAEGIITTGMAKTLDQNAKNLVIFSEFWPTALTKMGCDPAGYLARYKGLGFRFFDLPDEKSPLREVTSEQVMKELEKGDHMAQTNLLMIQPGQPLPKD
jgi:FkbM family methyltransferase